MVRALLSVAIAVQDVLFDTQIVVQIVKHRAHLKSARYLVCLVADFARLLVDDLEAL